MNEENYKKMKINCDFKNRKDHPLKWSERKNFAKTFEHTLTGIREMP